MTSDRTAPPLLEIRDASVFRADRRVFDRLTLILPSGSHAAILGPNGSGKSTLLQLLTRELYPVAGDQTVMRVLGQENWNVWDLRRRLGIVSHDLQVRYLGDATGLQVVLSGFTASLNTWEYQHFGPDCHRRASKVLAWLGIDYLADRRYDHMSTGEQRRCLLGRALVHEPSTLILDEPTSGLDLKACFQYLESLRSLMNRGKSVVIVTHHIHEIPPEIDLIYFLKEGRVAATGSRTELLTDEGLSTLFGTPIRLVSGGGMLYATPGENLLNPEQND